MPAQKLLSHLQNKTVTTVLAELTGGPGFKIGPIQTFLKQAQAAQGNDLPPGFEFEGVALPQSPGGVANSEPLDVIAKLRAENLLDGFEIIPHVTCKDYNLNALKSALVGYRNTDITTLLALTGDKPVGARGIFEIESVGLIDLISEMNRARLLQAKPDQWDHVPQFLAGAAVSPFKYTEASQMQQYYKMEKKINRGAKFFITQLGWDWRKSQDLMYYLRDRQIHIPVVGNVYLLTTKTPAPRLMYTGKLPGCYVSDALYKKLQEESFDEHVERAAQQVAMYRDLGVAGVDLGGLLDYDTFVRILTRAHEIDSDWKQHRNNLCWPHPNGFYLYNEQGRRNALSKPPRKLRQKSFNFFHNHFFTPDRIGTRLAQKSMRLLRADREDSIGHTAITAAEKTFKYLAFKCEDCGDCYLPENFGYCTLGRCEKGLSNAPCGDSTADGHCGNNSESRCTGELVYEAAAAETGGRERLLDTINAPRNPDLYNSPSWINFLSGRDHTQRNPLRILGEAINATHPSTHTALNMLASAGEEAWTQESGALNYLKALIESQAAAGADYITLNLDALNNNDDSALPWVGPCVRLVRQWGRGIPLCLTSQSYVQVEAGLQVWFDENTSVPAAPMVRWIGADIPTPVLQLKEKYDFHISLLIPIEDLAVPPLSSETVSLCHQHLLKFKQEATNNHGFTAPEITFELPICPLVKDIPESLKIPSMTFLCFEILKRIKQDKHLKGVHSVMDIAQIAAGLPRAIGVCRAFVSLAMANGLTSCWADAQRHYGLVPADGKLMALVDVIATMDGSPQRRQQAQERLDAFLSTRKTAPKPPKQGASPTSIPVESVKTSVPSPSQTIAKL